ncbi:MAG: polysaccharide biosynthesis/export family protein, partial [Steroidobacteraceae bacterium]
MRKLLLLMAWVLAVPALAQVPNAQQLEMLRNLTPEQRQMLLEQMGIGAEATSGTKDKVKSEDQASARPESGQPSDADLAERLQRASALRADDTLVITIGLPEPKVVPSTVEGQPPVVIDTTKDWDPLRKDKLAAVIARIKEKNPYRLNIDGTLQMPGFAAMPLAGLSEEQAALRLTAEPELDGLAIKVTRLPLTRSGPSGLKPFGYDLFKDSPSTFAPVTDVPVPADYVVGSGDELEVILYGNQNRTLRLTVGRDGRV